MAIKDVTDQVRRADLAARQERLTGPEIIQLPGTGRGGGPGGDEIHKVFCMEIAPTSTVINCFLDYNGNDATAWEEKHYEADEMVIGTDNYIYRCTSEHDATADNKPVTGNDYGDVWTVVFEINVYCRVHGGGYLNTTIPELIIGFPMEIWDDKGIWRSLETFNGATGCEIICEEV